MKKIIIALLVILSLVIALPSCDKEESNPDFDLLNELCSKDYFYYSISIVTETADSKLVESYDVAIEGGVKTVDYKTERYSTFEILPDGTVSVPTDFITVNEGTLTTEEDGEYAVPSFNFSYDSLKSDVVIGNTLKAKIVSMSKFIGSYMNVTEAKVVADYTPTTLRSIEISFVTEASQTVTVTYTFN